MLIGIGPEEVQRTLDESVITSEGSESSLPCNRGSFPSPSMPLAAVNSVEKVSKVSKQIGPKSLGVGIRSNPKAVEHEQGSSDGDLLLQSEGSEAIPRSRDMLSSMPHKGESPESVNDSGLKVDLTYTQRSRLAHTSEGVREASDGLTAIPCDRTDTGALSV